nr:hypothetical protein [uncultured Dethiosulfovibrio sp.]
MSSLRLNKDVEDKVKAMAMEQDGMSIKDAAELFAPLLDVPDHKAHLFVIKQKARKLMRKMGAYSVITSSSGTRAYRMLEGMTRGELLTLAEKTKREILKLSNKHGKIIEQISIRREQEEKESQGFIFKAQEMTKQAREEANKRDGTVAM